MNGVTTAMFNILTAPYMKPRDCKILCMNVLHKTGNEIQFTRFLLYLKPNILFK